MAFALLFSSFFFYYIGVPAPALLLRCGLSASLRFSPRAALALSGVAALCGDGAALVARGGLHAAPAPARARLIPVAFAGGTLGRSLLLMFTAGHTGSLPLLRLQVIPLLMLCLLSLLPARAGAWPKRAHGPAAFRALCFFCGIVDGFFGAGGTLLFSGLWPQRIERRRFSSPALPLLLTVCAQAGALLLTACAGASQVFPVQMVLMLGLGSALGALAAERQREHGAFWRGAGVALRVYLLLCALSGMEQAYLV